MDKKYKIVFLFIVIAVVSTLLQGYLSTEKGLGSYLWVEPAEPAAGGMYVVVAVDAEDTYNPSRMYYLGMTSSTWRNSMKDSFGKPVAITWYASITTGTCDPPPNQNKNCLREYDTILKYADALKMYKDSLEWHYHHCNGEEADIGRCGQEFSFNNLNKWKPEYVLNRMLIDRNFFPSSYRAGWEWEDTALSNFLEGVVFSDYSNDLHSGVWQEAPHEWTWYHPSSTDFKKRGDMSRYIHDCVPTYIPSFNEAWRIINENDVVNAFKRAAAGEDTIFCWWIHSWDPKWDIKFKTMQELLVQKSKEYGVKFIYANGREAMRQLINFDDNTPPTFTISRSGNNLMISSSEELFNGKPYGAIKLANGSYIRVQLAQTSSIKQWSYDITSLLGTDFTFAVGGTDKVGNVNTAKFNYLSTP